MLNHKFYQIIGMCIVLILGFFIYDSCKGTNIAHHHTFPILQHHGLLKKGVNYINPYETNIMAINLLNSIDKSGAKPNRPKINDSQYQLKVRECQYYIQWYLNHVNISDKYGLTGSIYDYQVSKNGQETVISDISAIDNRAASFILLLHRFYQVTGYRQMINQSKKKIENIVYLIPHLQNEKDGLICSLPTNNKKSLENNCLDHAAIDAFIKLSIDFNWDKINFYTEVLESINYAILDNFYQYDQGQFIWLIEGKGILQKSHTTDLEIFYPDSYSQLFPLLFQILPQEEKINERILWDKIYKMYKSRIKSQPVLQQIIFQWTENSMGVFK